MELLPNGGAELRLSMNSTYLVTMMSFTVLSARQTCSALGRFVLQAAAD